MMQLSLASGQPIAMKADSPAEAADVVHKACRCAIGFCPDRSSVAGTALANVPLYVRKVDSQHAKVDSYSIRTL